MRALRNELTLKVCSLIIIINKCGKDRLTGSELATLVDTVAGGLVGAVVSNGSGEMVVQS
jgi:hypothetical protein